MIWVCKREGLNVFPLSGTRVRVRVRVLACAHPLLRRGVLLRGVEGVLHTRQPAGQRQQQTDQLVQVTHKHAELVQLVGLAHALDGRFHLLAQRVVVQDVFLHATPRLPQNAQLLAQAADQLLLLGGLGGRERHTHTHRGRERNRRGER